MNQERRDHVQSSNISSS